MSALAELVENAEAAQAKRDELVTRRDGSEAEFRSIVEAIEAESREPDEKEAARCDELRSEIDSTDASLKPLRKEVKTIRKRIKEETQRARDKAKIAEARERLVSVDSITDVIVTQGERPIYGVAPDGERSPNSFYMDLVLRAKTRWEGTNDQGANKRLNEWAHQVEKEHAQGTLFGRAALPQIRETYRGEDSNGTRERVKEFEERGRLGIDQKSELRATAIGTDGGASATAPGEGSAFVTPVFDVARYAPWREFGRSFADACQKEQLPPYGRHEALIAA
jgi:hypothetical protein